MINESVSDGQTTVVTGGGRGIGRSVALGFATRGVNVVVAARREDEITTGAETIAEDVVALFERAREARIERLRLSEVLSVASTRRGTEKQNSRFAESVIK